MRLSTCWPAPPGPAGRAVVLDRLAVEIFESAQWLHAAETADGELLSASALLTEALRHRRQVLHRAQAGVATGCLLVTPTAPISVSCRERFGTPRSPSRTCGSVTPPLGGDAGPVEVDATSTG